MQSLLDRIIANPERCESIASGKELYEIAKNLLGLKVTKSMSKGNLCKAVKRAVQSAPVIEFEEKRETHDLSREIEEKVAPLTTEIRKQVLGQDLYDLCLEQGGRVEREQLSWRLKQLQEEGLFEGCSEEDLVRVCDFKTEPSSGCAKHLFERVREDKYTDFNTCAICADMEDEESLLPSRTPCGHMVHGSCLLKASNRYGLGLCPFCRKQLKVEKQGRKYTISLYEGEVRRVVHHRDDLERDAIEAALDNRGAELRRYEAATAWMNEVAIANNFHRYIYNIHHTINALELGTPVSIEHSRRYGYDDIRMSAVVPAEFNRITRERGVPQMGVSEYRLPDIRLFLRYLDRSASQRPIVQNPAYAGFWQDLAAIILDANIFDIGQERLTDESKKLFIIYIVGMAYVHGTIEDAERIVNAVFYRDLYRGLLLETLRSIENILPRPLLAILRRVASRYNEQL